MKIKKANIDDVEKIQELVNSFAQAGKMLPRSLNDIYENVRDFWVIKDNDILVGCCALHIVWDNISEIKSLAVKEKYQKKELGAKMVKRCIKEARHLKISRVFALTYVPKFFEKLKFKQGKKEQMPHKIWSECINCPHFPDCDEILVIREL